MALAKQPVLMVHSKSVPSSVNRHKHKRARTTGTLKYKASTPRSCRVRKVPRKLGPRDIGRNNSYKGTKYKDSSSGHWLDEKIHKHARSKSFKLRKSKNPVQKGQTIDQIGSPRDWQKPGFYQKEVEKMNKNIQHTRRWNGIFEALLDDKPIHTKDGRLNALKNEKIPKGMTVKQHGTPKGWKEIEYKYKNDGQKGFLDEKFWFDASMVHIDGGLIKLIEALPPDKKLQLIEVYYPTGYQSKVNFVKRLRDIVISEVDRLRKEDQMIKKIESKRVLEIVDDDDDKELNDHDEKYKMLTKRKHSKLGVLQRKLFTMKSVNKLTNLIDTM